MKLIPIAFLLPLIQTGSQGEKVLIKVDQDVNQRTEYQIKIEMRATDPDGKAVGKVDGAMHIADRVLARSADQITYNVHPAASFFKGDGVLQAVAESMNGGSGVDYKRTITLDGSPIGTSAASAVTSSVDLRFSPNPVGIGDTWTAKVAPGMNAELKLVFKLESITATEYKISATFDNVEMFEIAEPYQFVVDRKTGRYKTCTGALRVSTPEGKLAVRFNCRRILPALPQLYGKD
ncbi:MAG TPA: hypothetical protein VK171_03315 [Fimbriimonas sp.]|nr:hypothetical protein [Fimbriimonas sp.]